MNNQIKDGGPAFPIPIAGCNDGAVYNALQQSNGELGGMTLRDYFAAKAMQAYVAGGGVNDEKVARWAYDTADAMLKAREVQS